MAACTLIGPGAASPGAAERPEFPAEGAGAPAEPEILNSECDEILGGRRKTWPWERPPLGHRCCRGKAKSPKTLSQNQGRAGSHVCREPGEAWHGIPHSSFTCP